jgi:DNA repair protein SbcD/Mre11
MKLIHTADWHLGRILFGLHLTADQDHVLNQFVDIVRETAPDAVIVAGDIYDRAVPPIDAVQLLNRVLSAIVDDLGVPMILIAGNHDSPERLAFGSALLKKKNLFISGPVETDPEPVILEDGHGPVAICPIPYAEPSRVRESLGDKTIVDHETALASQLARARSRLPEGCRSVAVAHAFVTGGEKTESERPLMIGGSGHVDASIFEGFHYTVLGHLHRPQSTVGGKVRYSGSLLKYSFSEAGHSKSVDLVEIDRLGEATVKPISLTPRRDLRCISGLLDDLLAGGGEDPGSEDYLMVTIEDRGPRIDAMGKLRTVYPNVLHIVRDRAAEDDEPTLSAGERLDRSTEELFGAFFEEVTGNTLTEAEREEFFSALASVRAEEKGGGE